MLKSRNRIFRILPDAAEHRCAVKAHFKYGFQVFRMDTAECDHHVWKAIFFQFETGRQLGTITFF